VTRTDSAEIVRAHFDAKVRRDEAGLARHMKPDVRWWIPGSAADRGLERPIVGTDAVVGLLMSLSFYDPNERVWTIQHVVAEDSLVAVHATLDARIAATAEEYHNNYVFLFRLEDGKIAEVWEHLDTAYAYAKLDGSPHA
jgi:ketosteroid isomerase-like protein